MLTILTRRMSGGRVKAQTQNDWKPVTVPGRGKSDVEDHMAAANALRKSVIEQVKRNYPEWKTFPFQGEMIGGHFSKGGDQMVWVFTAEDNKLPRLDNNGDPV